MYFKIEPNFNCRTFVVIAVLGLLSTTSVQAIIPFGFIKAKPQINCSVGNPTPGVICKEGTIFLGMLSPGATSGSGTDYYMTTPGGCGEIPVAQIGGGSMLNAWPNADFTPNCLGVDSLSKYWSDGSANYYDIPSLTNYSITNGIGYGAINTDGSYGSTNTANIIAITTGTQGGFHAAARYCDKLNYGGFTDWYLPNRYELNLMYNNRSQIPGLNLNGDSYWSSTEFHYFNAWAHNFKTGEQSANMKSVASLIRCVRRIPDPCAGTPSPGTICNGGAIYVGSLSPGATNGSGVNKYMTTPGGCGEIPAAQKVTGINSPKGDYPSSDFTPICSGADNLYKYWNDGSSNTAVIPGLIDYSTTNGIGFGASNTDANYGSANTTNIVAITAAASGGYHAAALYCDKLSYAGYTDWYLPNRYELNLMYTNAASIAGLNTGNGSSWYWSSTEASGDKVWLQHFYSGQQYSDSKYNQSRVRCIRKF